MYFNFEKQTLLSYDISVMLIGENYLYCNRYTTDAYFNIFENSHLAMADSAAA